MDNQILKQALDTYGESMQVVKCIEELSELIQALSKSFTGTASRDEIVTEMADVLITLEYTKAVFNITDDELELESFKKLKRLSESLENAKSAISTSIDEHR